MAGQLSYTQSMYNPKDCFRSPPAPTMLLWRNGSAADAILELLESADCWFYVSLLTFPTGKLLYAGIA